MVKLHSQRDLREEQFVEGGLELPRVTGWKVKLMSSKHFHYYREYWRWKGKQALKLLREEKMVKPLKDRLKD